MAKNQGFVSLDYRNLSKLAKDSRYGPKMLAAHLTEGLREKKIRPDDFHIRALFEAIVPEGREMLMEYGTGGFGSETRELLEAGAVVSSQFSNITGQIVYQKVLEGYQNEEFVFTPLVDEFTSNVIGMEKVAGIGGIGDESEIVFESQPYPLVGPVEDYIEIPEARKRGHICPLTWEAVFADRTGQLLKQAGDVGYWVGYAKERRVIDSIVDENGGAVSAALGGHRYFWRGTSYATYQTATPYDNVTTANALVDWTDIEGAELTLSRITDPNTGTPILIQPTHIIVTKQLEYTARYIVQSTSMNIHTGGYATSGTLSEYRGGTLIPKYQIATSRLLETRMATDTDWYLCNPKKAWGYKVIRPLKVDQAPANHPDEFSRDIVNQWKASEFGAAFTLDPRLSNESRA